jgi:RimJ/RimL family protein N-acetyltransferase
MLWTRSAAVSRKQCRRGRHVVEMPRLRFQTPTLVDLRMMAAAASDSQAQRWLGWPADQLILDPYRERLLALQPGWGRPVRTHTEPGPFLIAVDKACERLAGAIGFDRRRGEVGGWLSPSYRSRGFGTELFTGAVLFVHHHLGEHSVRAGTETTNIAAASALRSAGFQPTTGPSTHELPDGRVIPTLWFRHDTDRPGRYRAISEGLC